MALFHNSAIFYENFIGKWNKFSKQDNLLLTAKKTNNALV